MMQRVARAAMLRRRRAMARAGFAVPILLMLHLVAPTIAGKEEEAAALLVFKRASVASDPRGALDTWVNATNGSPCAWAGVSCIDGSVRVLDLSGMSLAGRLTLQGLVELPQLRSLNLGSNGFYGNLSDHTLWSSPCLLRDVDLSSNTLNGTLPRAFLPSCGRLRFLNMSSNSLIGGGFPFPQSLRTLDMSNNQLSDAGFLNYSLTGCHGVQYLNLSANRFTGRLPDIPPCSKVAVLDLSWNLLLGLLPPNLVAAAPVTLTHLTIAGNKFSGDISAYEFGICSSLTVLDWSHNQLRSKGLPPSLANCRRLKMLDMSGNELLSGMIPEFIGEFPSLRRLKLAGNNFFGEIPDRLSLLCDKLVELDLSSNQLIGSLPESFLKCRSLEVLDLGRNQLSGEFVVTVISNMSSLRFLRMPFNNITGENPLPALASGCPLLEEIALGSNEFYGEIMPNLCSSLPLLRKLILPNNYLSGAIPPSLGHCHSLETIHLSFNLLVGRIPPEILVLPKLVELVLWANNLSGEIPDMLCSNGTTLETLDISYNNFSGSIPPSITMCVNLIWVSLAGNHLTGNVPPGFGNLKKLAILQLNNNSLSGLVPAELGSCSNLIWLDLNRNYFTGTIPQQLAAQAGLITGCIYCGKQYAYLRNEVGNICPGAGVAFEFLDIRPERLLQLPSVKSCPSTRIYSGPTISTFSHNGSMLYLDLSFNGLTGVIPSSLGSMMHLQILNLGNNKLAGLIPETFAGLKSLGVLVLSHNQLTGAIPQGLASLTFLADLDVSYNHLTGQIPTSGQLMTFPPSSYENNSGLCGIPLPPCGRFDNGDGEHKLQDIPDAPVPVVSPTGLGIGLAFGFIVGFGSGIFLPL